VRARYFHVKSWGTPEVHRTSEPQQQREGEGKIITHVFGGKNSPLLARRVLKELRKRLSSLRKKGRKGEIAGGGGGGARVLKTRYLAASDRANVHTVDSREGGEGISLVGDSRGLSNGGQEKRRRVVSLAAVNRKCEREELRV